MYIVKVWAFPKPVLEGTNMLLTESASGRDIGIQRRRFVLTDIAQRKEIVELNKGIFLTRFLGGVENLPINLEVVRQLITVSVPHGSFEPGSAGALVDQGFKVLEGSRYDGYGGLVELMEKVVRRNSHGRMVGGVKEEAHWSLRMERWLPFGVLVSTRSRRRKDFGEVIGAYKDSIVGAFVVVVVYLGDERLDLRVLVVHPSESDETTGNDVKQRVEVFSVRAERETDGETPVGGVRPDDIADSRSECAQDVLRDLGNLDAIQSFTQDGGALIFGFDACIDGEKAKPIAHFYGFPHARYDSG